ncbi:MAG: excinuclease ABC subunit UvrC [Halanaerobiaceae bacterium]
MDDTREQIEEQIAGLPDEPGVYMMKDLTNTIIYVGKAVSLRKRVRSYFREGNHTYKTRVMVDNVADFDYMVTDTEVEAYILEANLIKKYQPRYNIRLKDDKTYPYIKVTVQEDFPRIFKTRLVKKDGSRYFGPFANVDAVYKTLNTIKDLFSLRRCKKDLDADNPEDRPCLNYHIDKCLGPCIGEVTPEEYGELIDQACLFLSGRQEELISRVEEKMYEASENKNFEKAARLRDAREAFKEIDKQQKVMSDKNLDQDVIALARNEEGEACVQLLLLRQGRLIGQEHFMMEGSEDEELQRIMGSFLQQYYEQAPKIPDEILVNSDFAGENLLADRLQKKKGKKVGIHLPERGNKKRLVEMAEKNARENLKKESIKQKYARQRTSNAALKLQEKLDLPEAPEYIEGMDISNIQGTDPVASLVVFREGVPAKKDYRRFKIKTVQGADDFAMMREVAERRYSRLLDEERPLPDLILVDGGKGQLNAVKEVLDNLGLFDQPVIGLAKKEEEVFLPGQQQPVIFDLSSGALQLLQRVRDEAHRFAVSYHRKLRSRRLTHSMLDDIPGIGPERRKALLQHFGSLEKIKNARISQLKEAEGISSGLARRIFDYLKENTRVY